MSKYKTRSGVEVPRVTQVIDILGYNKRTLMNWVYKEMKNGQDPYAKRDKALSVGTLTHNLIEAHVKHLDLDETIYGLDDIAVAHTGYNKYVEWEQEACVEYLETEHEIISEQFLYGGTADAVVRIGGKVTLLDYKTSAGIYPDHVIQVAAYYHGINEQAKHKVEDVVIIHIDKKAAVGSTNIVTPHVISPEKIAFGWEAFQCALKLYNLQKKLNV